MEVSVPTRFMRDWIQNHYAERILAMCIEESANGEEEVKRLQIVVVQNDILDDDSDQVALTKANQHHNLYASDASSRPDERVTHETSGRSSSNV